MNHRKRETPYTLLIGAVMVLTGPVLFSSCCIQPSNSEGETTSEKCEPVDPVEFLEALADGGIGPLSAELSGVLPTQGKIALPRPLTSAGSSDCPVVNFLQAGLMPLATSSLVAGLQRQPNGSFTGWEYENFAPFSFVQSTPAVYCSGGAPTFQNLPGWKPLATKLGVTSRPIIFADLFGNGTPVGLAIVPAGFMSGGTFLHQPATTSLMVAIPNSNGTAQSFTFYPVPTNAQSILVGNFSSDSNLDVVVIGNTNTNGIALYLGNGDGSLQQPNYFSADQGPVQAAAYDFNHDGSLDLAVVNSVSNDVSILLGNGKGSFAPAANYPAGIVSTNQIAVGNFRGTGAADLAVSAGSSFSVLFNNGSGTFGAGIVTTSSFNFISGLAAGDFNNDGKTDLVLTDSAGGTLSVFLSDGTGHFPTEYDYVAGDRPAGLFAMDLNGDGKLDVVIASGHPDMLIPNEYAQFITVFLGRGDGSLSGPPAYHAGNSPNAIAFADFKRNGHMDTVAATGSSSLWIGIAGEAPVSINLGSGVSASGVAAADVNGDHIPDIVVGDANGSGVYVLLGEGDGTFQNPANYPTNGAPVNALAIADLNGDQKPDIVFCGYQLVLPPVGTAGILVGNGNCTFQSVAKLSGFGSGYSPASLAVGNFDQTGNLDVAILDQGYANQNNLGGLYVYINQGGGVFQAPVPYPVGQNPVFVAAANVNGGPAADLIVSTQDPNYSSNGQWDVAVLLANGNGTFQSPSYIATQPNPNAIAIGDYNGDGIPDLAIGHCCISSFITYMQGNGNGTFQAETEIPTLVAVNTLAAANLVGNNASDLVAGMGLRVGYVSVFANLLNLPNPCAVSGDATPMVTDVQYEINEALGSKPAANDLNADGVVNVVDIQIVINGALSLGCSGV